MKYCCQDSALGFFRFTMPERSTASAIAIWDVNCRAAHQHRRCRHTPRSTSALLVHRLPPPAVAVTDCEAGSLASCWSLILGMLRTASCMLLTREGALAEHAMALAEQACGSTGSGAC